MKISLLLALAFMFGAALQSHARADSLVSLETYMLNNDVNDPAVLSYVLLRCSAQMSYTGMLMEGVDKSSSANMIKIGEAMLGLATIMTEEQTSESTDVISQRNFNAVKAMMENHVQRGNANYIKSGSYLDEGDFENLNVCQQIRQSVF